MSPPCPLGQILPPSQSVRILLDIRPTLRLALQHQIEPIPAIAVVRPPRQPLAVRIAEIRKADPLGAHLLTQGAILGPRPHVGRVSEHERHLGEVRDALVGRR